MHVTVTSKLLWLGALLVVGLVWFLGSDIHLAGFRFDDGLYLLAGRSLAEGHGFHLTSEVPIVKYPPLYPLLMSVVWRFFPSFPENLPVFVLLNIAMALVAIAILPFLTVANASDHGRPSEEAVNKPHATPWISYPWDARWWLLLLVGLHPLMFKMVGALFSESFFMLISFVVLLYAQRMRLRARQVVVLAMLASLAFYVKTIAFTLIAAICLWLWFQKRMLAYLFLLLSGLFCFPWVFWLAQHSVSPIVIGDYSAISYNMPYTIEWLARLVRAPDPWWFFMKGAGHVFVALGQIVLPLEYLMLPRWVLFGVLLPLGLLGFSGLVWQLIKGLREHRVDLIQWYIFFFLMVLFAWALDDYLNPPRFLMPLLPLVLMLCFQAVKRQVIIRKILLMTLIVFYGWFYIEGLYQAEKINRVSKAVWADYQETFQFMSGHLTPEDKFFTLLPNVYPLYVASRISPQESYWFFDRTDKSLSPDQKMALFYKNCPDLMLKLGLRYVVVEPFKVPYSRGILVESERDDDVQKRVDANPARYQLLFEAPNATIRLYRILPAQDPSRKQAPKE